MKHVFFTLRRYKMASASRLRTGLITMCCALLAFHVNAQYSTTGDAASTSTPPCGTGDCFQLTDAVNNQSGAVWNDTPINLDQRFRVCFQAHLGDRDAGADGISFVFQSDSRGTSALGGKGGFIGYGPTHPTAPNETGAVIEPSLTIEIDTWDNSAPGGGPGGLDIPEDHISIIRNGEIMNPLVTETADPGGADIEDGECHDVCIEWDPQTKRLSVTFDGNVRINEEIDLQNDPFNGSPQVTWGLTAATGAENNQQVVCIQSVEQDPQTCCNSNCPSIAVNGSFDGAFQFGYNTDFPTVGYDTMSGSFRMTEGPDPSTLNSAWNRASRTLGGGDMLILDGPSGLNGDRVAWGQNATTIVGEEYCISAFVSNICPLCGPTPSFDLVINGVVVASAVNIQHADGWVELCATFIGTGNDNIEIFMRGNAAGFGIAGNDGAIDDITIRRVSCDCCDDFDFILTANVSKCLGSGTATFTGDPELCDTPFVALANFDNVAFLPPSSLLGHYTLSPGELRPLAGYLISQNGDTLCADTAFVGCPVGATCCEGLWATAEVSPTAPGMYDLYLSQSPVIPCSVYSVRVDGVVTASNFGSPLSIPVPWVTPGLSIGTVDPLISPTPTIEYLDQFSAVICSEVLTLGSGGPFKTAPEEIAEEATDNPWKVQIAPNPAGATATLSLDLPKASEVTVELYDLSGRIVRQLHQSEYPAGPQQVLLETSDLPTGLYLLHVKTAMGVHAENLVIQH